MFTERIKDFETVPFAEKWGQFDVERAKKGAVNFREMIDGLNPQLRVKLTEDPKYIMEIANLFIGTKPVWFDCDGWYDFNQRENREIRHQVGKYFKQVSERYFVNVGLCLKMIRQADGGEFDNIKDEQGLINVFRDLDIDIFQNINRERDNRSHRLMGILLGYPIEDVELFNSPEKFQNYDWCVNSEELGWAYGSYSSEREARLNLLTKKVLVESGLYPYIRDNLVVRP